MNLANPITITPPTFTRKDGTIRTFNPITLNELDITIIDNATRKRVVVQIRSIPQQIVLWEKEEYDAVGDYTQAQVENRVLELLGSDPKAFLESLFLELIRR